MLSNMFKNIEFLKPLGKYTFKVQNLNEDEDILSSKLVIFYVPSHYNYDSYYQKLVTYLCDLSNFSNNLIVGNLGVFLPEINPKANMEKLQLLFEELFTYNIHCICISDNPMISYCQYIALGRLNHNTTLSYVNERIALHAEDVNVSNDPIFSILDASPSSLKNINLIGFQNYFSDIESKNLLQKLCFDLFRLGDIKNNLKLTEPAFRESDLIHFDLNALNNCLITGVHNPTPNGLYPEEACQIMRFAGTSPIARVLNVTGYCAENDSHDLTLKLLAQLVWHFIEGFDNRINEIPHKNDVNFTQYIVTIDSSHELLFIKSKRTDRWWIEISIDKKIVYEPCTYDDYVLACKGEIPNRLTQAILKHTL